MIDILKAILLSLKAKAAYVGVLVAIVSTVAVLLGVEVPF